MWYPRGYTHIFLCARSPRTSGFHSRPVSGPRPLLLCAAARDCWPVPRGSRLPRLHVTSAAPIKPYATPCTPSTSGARRAPAPLVATAHDVNHLRRWGLRLPPGTVAPESTDVRQAHQPVDPCAGRRGQFRPGAHAAAGQRYNPSAGPPPAGSGVEARQALDYQSRSRVCPKTKRRDRLIQRAMAQPTWGLGFGDEVWWSRLAPPNQHGWTEAEATDKLQELSPPADDPAPKALACYGLLVRPHPRAADQMWRRFVPGRPVRGVTIDFLAWGAAPLAAPGFTALRRIWDNASWHRRPAVRRWRRHHHQQVKRGALGVRIVVCQLPSTSPWLNPIEPKWVHGKRAVSEADRLLRADELEARVYAYYGYHREAHLIMPKKVA